MGRLDIVSFSDEHLGAAAALLAARHARHRVAEPLLSERFEDPAAARVEVETSWSQVGASGAAALDGGRVVGYLLGVPRSGGSWGPSSWVEHAGHAVEDAEVVRDLYAFAAARWVEQGATHHYALVPNDAALLTSWFRLGFGQQQGLGIQAVPAPATVPVPGRVSARRATADDVDALIAVDILGEYQGGSPVFAPSPAPDPAEQRAELLDELADDRAAVLLAEVDGRAVGCATAAPVEYSGLHTSVARPEQACILGYAATLPDVRGSGAGLALVEGVFAWAREEGYATIVVDWRVTNLLASRFWPARGFRTSFVRLFRPIV